MHSTITLYSRGSSREGDSEPVCDLMAGIASRAVSGAGQARVYSNRIFLALKRRFLSLQTCLRPWSLQPTLPTRLLSSGRGRAMLLFAVVLTELSGAQATLGLLENPVR